jgi:hypothetical protein
VIALASHPAAQALVTAAEESGKCNGRTCGPVAVFGVLLMFAVLAGGSFMLLSSSFGVLQAYLVSSIAFWGSWFVLAIIWFTGVPGLPLPVVPDIPQSTPRYYGPQGRLPSWEPAPGALATSLTNWISAAGTQRDSDTEAIKSAETAATETIAEHYAAQTGAEKSKITVPGSAQITNTEISRSGAAIKYIKFTTDKATPGQTATEEEKAVIAKITPATFVFVHDRGTESLQTLIALPMTFILMAAHLFALIWYERRHRPGATASASERERIRVAVS